VQIKLDISLDDMATINRNIGTLKYFLNRGSLASDMSLLSTITLLEKIKNSYTGWEGTNDFN